MSARIGTRSALPVIVVIAGCLLFFEYQQSLSVAPLIGWLIVFGLEKQRTYGVMMAVSMLPGLVGAFIFDPPYGMDQMAGQFQVLAGKDLDPRALTELIFRLWPAVAFLEYLLMFFWGYRLAFVLAPRLGITLPPAVSVAQWRPWEELIWVAIVALILSVLDFEILAGLALNIAVVMTILYAAQGFGVAMYFTNVLVSRLDNLPVFGRVFLKWFPLWFFLLTGFWIFLVIVGLLDTWFDWRKLKPQPLDTDQ